MKTIYLIDLSSIAFPIWHVSASEPDPNHCSTKIVARVRALASQQPHVAICCDSGRSFRNDLAPSYKANRPESDARIQHQIALAVETLKGDGFPIWSAKGFEADDVIASAVTRALALEETEAVIVSADKDLLQLVGERVSAMSVRDGSLLAEAEVVAKFGVKPSQMRDFLTMVGDKSDNIKGINGIGEKRAAELLDRFHSLDELYRDMREVGVATLRLTPFLVTALKEFEPHRQTTRDLITLRTDVELPFDDVLKPRVPTNVPSFDFSEDPDMENETTETEKFAEVMHRASAPEPAQVAPGATTSEPTQVTTMAVREADVLAPAPAEWERQLDPRSMRDARIVSKDLFDSRMFSAYGTPQAILSTVMVGRELGLPAMASLRSIHIIEGKHSLSAALMTALVLRSGLAQFFEPISFSETEATYETHRKGARNPVTLTHTFEMATKAWPKTKADWEKSFLSSGWGRNPTDMLVARATARLARMVYPDLLAGLYTPEELIEIREGLAA